MTYYTLFTDQTHPGYWRFHSGSFELAPLLKTARSVAHDWYIIAETPTCMFTVVQSYQHAESECVV